MQVFRQLVAGAIRECPRLRGLPPERGLVRRQRQPLALADGAFVVAIDEQEIAIVGDEDLPVALDVAGHLLRLSDRLDIITGALDLDHAAGGCLRQRLVRVERPQLVRREQAAIGNARSRVLHLEDGSHPWLQLVPDRVDQGRQGLVIGRLPRRRAGRADGAEITEVGFDRIAHGCTPGELLLE